MITRCVLTGEENASSVMAMSAIFTVCWISEASIKCLPFNLNLSKGEEKIVRRSQVWSVAWMIQLCDPLFCYKNRWLHCKACPILVSRDDEKNAFTVGTTRYALQLKMKMIAEVFTLYKEKRCNWGKNWKNHVIYVEMYDLFV